MCGRYSLVSADSVLDQLELAGALPDWQAAYNMAPGQDVPCVIERPDSGPQVAMLRWGLVPHWARDPKVGYKMINARRETVAEKPAFRDSL
ncbi:MAG: SOS response-associated peptidase, partial [Deltaproteobacteria bacterium]|nr:SOS response-associated peptidase [Deltaproteobacteria bacterium]